MSNANETLERQNEKNSQRDSGSSIFAKSFGLPRSNKIGAETVSKQGDGIDEDQVYD
jgi:hypothetical protein